MTENPDVNKTGEYFFGVYRTCEQFVHEAVSAGHPVGKSAKLPEALQSAVDIVAAHSMYEVAKHRHDTLAYWLSRAKALGTEEAALHESLPESLRSILSPKRLLLWKEMLEFYSYPDVAIFEEVVAGTRLAGAAPVVPAFDPCFKPAKSPWANWRALQRHHVLPCLPQSDPPVTWK